MLHEELYSSANLTDGDSSAYLRSLAEGLLSAHARHTQNIRLKIDVSRLFLNREKAIPAGMILNELINNSCKHAFSNDEPGEIRIHLRQIDARICLNCQDSGGGFKEILDARQSPPIGMRLLNL